MNLRLKRVTGTRQTTRRTWTRKIAAHASRAGARFSRRQRILRRAKAFHAKAQSREGRNAAREALVSGLFAPWRPCVLAARNSFLRFHSTLAGGGSSFRLLCGLAPLREACISLHVPSRSACWFGRREGSPVGVLGAELFVKRRGGAALGVEVEDAGLLRGGPAGPRAHAISTRSFNLRQVLDAVA